ncbi:PRKC apoptosis WT1 regulator protein-like isoform X2 [Dendropsophus ebraccatus]|uniref:PRKC apoptosis WT1 regulator protein-like isoform X2 n=1 Tax=Dendropsophus ebraccatus TaxID=150705 RepID=UPI0038312A67
MSRDMKSSSAEQVPFMEEWKARRERMRLRSSSSLAGSRSIDSQVQQEVELQTQSWSSHIVQTCDKDSKRVQSQASLDVETHDPVTSKTKEKKGSPQKKHRTQIEKRKLREKRRPTGIVNLIQTADTEENEDINANDENKAQGTAIQELWMSDGTCKTRYQESPLISPTSGNRSESWMEELQKKMTRAKDENKKLKEENQMLLKMMGQLSS